MENKDLENKLKTVAGDDIVNKIKTASEALGKEEKVKIDFLELKDDVHKQAKNAIETIVNFYFKLDDLNDNIKSMIESKMDMDVVSLHSVLYQIKTSDYATAQILDEINNGVTIKSVRLFEALNGLQKTNIDSTKTLNSMLNTLDKQYSELHNTVEQKMLEDFGDEDSNKVKRGTKNIIKNLSDINEEIERLNRKGLRDEQ